MRGLKPQRSFMGMKVSAYEGGVEIGVMEHGNRVSVKAYSGKRNTPDFYYAFRSMEAAEKHIAEYLDGLKKSAESKVAQRAESKKRANSFLESLKVGQILYTSWGYDQTNVEFFEVVEIKGSAVMLRELAQDCKETGFMSGNTVPMKGHYLTSPPIKRIVRGDSIKISESRNAYPWRGEPCYVSWYA